MASVNDGDYIDPQLGKVSVNGLAATWLEGKKGTVKPKYWGDLESSWRVHVAPKWARRQVGTIRYSEVQAWVSAMSAERSATIVRRAYDVLNGVCKLAVKDGVMRKNPCEGVQLPRKTHKARTYLTVEQLLALADAAGEHRAVILTLGFCGLRFGELRALRVEDVHKARTYLTVEQLLALADAAGEHRAVILTLGFCGLRFGELRALRVEDVDVERSRLLVRHSVVRVNGVYIEGLPKTHERREVPVAPSVMNVILGECVGKQHDDLLFPGNAHGRWLVEQSARGKGWYARAIAVAGVPPLTMHDLRHTAASIAISSGANVKAVQRMLGHKTAAMTLDTYADLFDTDLDMHDLRHTAASIAISSGANVKAVQRMLGHKTAAMTLDTYADLFDTDLDAVAMDVERRICDVLA